MPRSGFNHRIPASKQEKRQKRQEKKQEGLRVRAIRIEPKNERKADYLDAIREYPLVFSSGSAGTGKTFLAVAEAVNQVIDKRTPYEKIIIVRPAVEAGGEKIGYLPGKIDEKMAPFMIPIFDSIRKVIHNRPETFLAQNVEIAVLAYMRGRTLENCVVLLDEAQNMTPDQMLMFLTRLGNNCKAIVTGDPEQSDMPVGQCGLTTAIDRLGDSRMIGFIEFREEDIVRSRVAREVLRFWHRNQSNQLLEAIGGVGA